MVQYYSMYDYTVDERKLMMKEAFRGSGIGVIFMAVFGTLWAGTGVMGLQGGVSIRGTRSHIRGNHHGYRWHFINTCITKMSNQVSDDGARRLKRIGFLFNMVFIAEGLLIGIAIAICNLINQTDLIPGVIAIIVGIHFYHWRHFSKSRFIMQQVCFSVYWRLLHG
ncbi:hypothetical protein KEH51_23190 [[Brevibacterium] frigoritolerans]|uniref:Uncharacterized protein n=1 Tax=Peribacillus frigoritolerans TaxID=450367 RepID=A0A941FJF6_9BACI|nr:hypothetical protein [Peribacillus frigoritolerans]